MEPAHIYFKNVDIDQQEQTFTLNFSKENEIENVIFDKDYEYAVTGLKINADLPVITFIKKNDVLKQNEISKEIQELIKKYREPDMTLTISNRETKSIQIRLI